MSDTDSLQYLPMERWGELEEAFKTDWPRGISGYTALRTQRDLVSRGLGYGFKVYCPFGDVSSGMVALNKKHNFNEVWIQCPKDDTESLENALLTTNVIDWTQEMTVPFIPQHLYDMLLRVTKKLGVVFEGENWPTLDVIIYQKTQPAFENICLPDGIQFKSVLEKDIDMVDSKWIIRYDGSKSLFRLLVKADLSYGLYKDNILISWIFISEVGNMAHLHTPEEYRRKGYAILLLKLLCNKFLEEKRDLFGYCESRNVKALNLYEKLGFEKLHYIRYTVVKPK
ncbi:uncharacterized protein LOC114362040 isoform X3 [Ostrinia furnacalis]|uniref:uncharacterized protein LOC114362040 isoform X3 n=1 Tax=Ostrinia furnacalis TaxID=93504 RepID=UPI00103DD1CC|nr:uncharacterized protein LOC114362040 isoform X3 [Ostrinia furnacalis]